MARPTKPKDLKPKSEGEVTPMPGPAPSSSGAAFDLKFIVLVVVIVLSSILGSAGSAYLMATMFVMPEIAKVAKAPAAAEGEEGGEEGGHGEEGGATNQVGMNLELDEFTVNLKTDPTLGGNQYLRAKMALSIKVPEAQNCYAQEHHAQLPPSLRDGQIVGAAAPVDRTTLANGGEGAPSCDQVFKDNMSKYVPTIRDVINSSLLKRTATVLATIEGQEALKDEVKDQLNQMMAPDYEVLRVNFQDFIIQR